MRKIKFRAWDKTNKVIVNDENILIDFKGRLWVRHISTKPKLISKLYDKSYIIMQYTGLKDCKVKEIYEGDILKIKPNSEDTEIVEVIFHKGCFCYKTKEGGIFAFYSSEDCMCITENREVIGNIYENPKLLK